MGTIEVNCSIRIYEDDLKPEYNWFHIRNHWHDDRKIVIELNGRSYTCLASELTLAIKNATNSKAY